MIPIKIILITMLVLIVSVYFRRIRSRMYDRLLLLMVLIVGVVMILFPDLTTDIAQLLGVGRGADMVIYISLLGLGLMWMMLYTSHRELRARMTDLTRTMAIQNAIKPTDDES